MTVPDLRNAGWMARCIGRGELAPFSDEAIVELGRLLGTRQAEPGTSLLAQGTSVDHIGIILRGEVELTHRRRGRREVLQILHPGDVYGDIPLLCSLPTPFGARAASDVQVIELGVDRFWALLEHQPQICRRVLFSVASRLERMQRRLLTVTAGDLTHQVTALLLDEIGPASTMVPLSQTTIAGLLGTTRPSVNRVLRTLAEAGQVRLHYRRIEVLDPAGLAGRLA